jgi:hypothetical protein
MFGNIFPIFWGKSGAFLRYNRQIAQKNHRKTMIKPILSVLAGLAAAVALFLLGEQMNHSLYPTPLGFDFSNAQAVKTFYDNQPLAYWLIALLVWAIGSFACGAIIKIISKSPKPLLPLIAGGILTASGIANIFSLPQPLWFSIIGLLIFLPSVYLGFRLIGKNALQTA